MIQRDVRQGSDLSHSVYLFWRGKCKKLRSYKPACKLSDPSSNMLCSACMQVIDLTRSSYTLQVSVYGYSNPSKQELSGVCCDDLCSACYTTFQFCLQREDSRHAEDMMAECSLGFLSTDGSPILDAEDKLVFTLGKEFTKGLQNPLEFTGSQLFVS